MYKVSRACNRSHGQCENKCHVLLDHLKKKLNKKFMVVGIIVLELLAYARVDTSVDGQKDERNDEWTETGLPYHTVKAR